MCVIIIKKKGQPLPNYNMLFQAHKANPHGCGFFSDGHYYKSLSFCDFYTNLQRVGIKENCIMHFRLATHGSVCRENCHPFMHGNLGFAHNGVLNVQPHGDETDSEAAFLRYIVPAFERYGYDSPHFSRILNKIAGWSKFALLYNGKLRTYGNFVRYNGYLCSNLRFAYSNRFANLDYSYNHRQTRF